MKDLHTLKTFAEDDVFRVVVECPRGSAVKLKYAADLGAMSISRPLTLGVVYPCDWGFVPSTKAPDGDPVDAAVWWDVSTYPGVVISCRALGVVRIEQNKADGEGRIRNDRIIARPVDARRETSLRSRARRELEQFFLSAVALEDKDPKILGCDDAAAALELIQSSAA